MLRWINNILKKKLAMRKQEVIKLRWKKAGLERQLQMLKKEQ